MPTRVLQAVLVSALAIAVFTPTVAKADPYVGIGLGPALRLDDWPNQLRVEQEIGYSFDGRGGFFLSFAPMQSWGADFWVLSLPLGIGGLFDIFHNSDVTFQLGPMGHVGFALAGDFDGSDRDPDAWFYFGGNFMLRLLVLNDRLGIYVKPIGLEFGVGDGDSRRGHGDIVARYYLSGGIQYYF
ncbi:MAG: hypothetical protein AB8I08_39920 [Sandaracinaceae bacterium]